MIQNFSSLGTLLTNFKKNRPKTIPNVNNKSD